MLIRDSRRKPLRFNDLYNGITAEVQFIGWIWRDTDGVTGRFVTLVEEYMRRIAETVDACIVGDVRSSHTTSIRK